MKVCLSFYQLCQFGNKPNQDEGEKIKYKTYHRKKEGMADSKKSSFNRLFFIGFLLSQTQLGFSNELLAPANQDSHAS